MKILVGGPVEGNEAPVLPSRLMKVIFSPGKLFEALRTNPVWFGALAVCAAMVALAMLLIPAEIWEQMIREQAMEQSARTGQPVPDDFGVGSSVMRVFSVIAPLITFAIWAFLLTALVTFIFAFVLGDDGRYRQYLSVVCHSLFIGALGAVLITPLRIIEQDIQLTLSVGTFLFFLGEGYWARVMNMLDLFQLWSYGVMAVGVTKVDPRRGFGSALVVFLLIAVAFAMLFGIFGG